MRELIQMCSAEIEQIMRIRMVAEYQELEEQNLFHTIIGEGYGQVRNGNQRLRKGE